MKKIIFISLTTLLSILVACNSTKPTQPTSPHQEVNGVPPYVPEDKKLYDTIVAMDSIFFGAYNTCKLEVHEDLISEDIEFYHDRGGLTTSKKQLIDALRNNICGKVRRELLKGSIEVYPVPGYGAVQMGAHRFHNLVEKSVSRYAKFVSIWQWKDGKWFLTRVISLH